MSPRSSKKDAPRAGVKPRKKKRASGKRLPARNSSARTVSADELVRLNKYLADQGVASRRGCDELIAAGKVLVDDQPVTAMGSKIDPGKQRVTVNGRELQPLGTERRYYVLNKPSGVICTNERQEKKPRAIDMITDKHKGRIYTVGRLDEDSKGLVILTNDGAFADRVAHPRYGVAKTYLVKVQGRVAEDAVQKLREGVHLADGRTGQARILVIKRSHKTSTLSVTIREGRNREVRRVFARVGYKVTELKRTAIGPLSVRGLRIGQWRALGRAEIEELLAESSGEQVLPVNRRQRATRPVQRKKASKRARASGTTKAAAGSAGKAKGSAARSTKKRSGPGPRR